jgi:hypothetical protein
VLVPCYVHHICVVGMSLDTDDDNEDGPAKEVNWRSCVDKHGGNLTNRQTKLLDKIR